MASRKADLRSLGEGSLQAGRVVLVQGLEQQPELNGLCGEIVQWHQEKGRYSVRLPAKAVLLRPVSLHLPLPQGRQVLLSDLPEQWKEFNGLDARIAKFLPETCCYQVELPKRFKSSNIPKSIEVKPCNVVDDNVKCKSYLRTLNSQLTEEDKVAMAEEMMQRAEPIGYDDLRKMIPGMVNQPRQMFSGIAKDDLVRHWQAKVDADASMLAYKDAPPGLLSEMDARLAEHIQTMSTFTPEDARQANACLNGNLETFFDRACDLNDKGRTDKAIGPAKAFIDVFEAAPFIASLVEFEIRHLPHPDDNVGGCAHMVSTMYGLCGNDPESSLAVRCKRMLYAFHLRMHMYCRAVGSERPVWLRRLSETAGNLSSILEEQHRIDDAVFFFKVFSGWTWASGKSDKAAKKMMLSVRAGKTMMEDSKGQFATSAMRNGKVIRGVSKTSLKTELKACINCSAVEPRPDEFKSCACHAVSYCGVVCQKQHWKVHKETCAAKRTDKTQHVGL
mmetsp:Transcript_12507/g.24075  ORF Transcript_12507/g.24075 Transcript_12507/m.24075 type:complete len:503 (+) Transcript_12507:50-1558(+)|eukprot:CAMPEP_0172679734 /NCGR_PEP_ID=MMETSP1074-20121228/16273_1 /TAXON_ID=2916 /ORGANISM="Ceratium fusus, Strain PA161109" /LENGTH=502 /DNA_ID=CAMNT_0013497957 /DNA_START=23 /DNA_END=1531 /DNA_ORIENTATION=+